MKSVRLHQCGKRPVVEDVVEPDATGAFGVVFKISGAGLFTDLHIEVCNPGPDDSADRVQDRRVGLVELLGADLRTRWWSAGQPAAVRSCRSG